MLSISDECFAMLANEARDRGVNIQMLLRAVIIPEWTRLDPDSKVSTVNNTSGSGTSSENTKVDVPVLSQNRKCCSPLRDRKSTRLNSSHGYISYAVFCLKKKKKTYEIR